MFDDDSDIVDTTDSGSDATPMDSSVISGATSPAPDASASAPIFSTSTPSYSGAGVTPPAQPAATAAQPVQPDYTQQSVQSLPTASGPGPKPSFWQTILMGALYGLAGSAGAKHFGAGLAGGAAGVVQNAQQQVQNAQAAKQLQFESIRAADSHIAALDEHRRADQLDDEGKLDYKSKSAEYQAFLQDNFGVEPNLSFNDSHTDAIAALQTGADQNGGTIPPVATVQQPAPDGEHGQISAYSPTQQQMQQNSNGYRNLINTQRAVQGLPEIDDPTFISMGFKGQRDAAQNAISFLKPTPDYSLDKTKPDYLPVVLAQKQQQLQQYENHKDINGKSDTDPVVEKQLQNGIDYLQSAWDSSGKMEDKQAADLTTATETAKEPFVEKEHQFQANLQRQNQDATRQMTMANTLAQKGVEDINRMWADPQHGYSQFAAQAQLTKSTISSAKNGSELANSLTPLMTALGVTTFASVHRINQTEVNAAGPEVGSLLRRMDSILDKAATGKVPAATLQETNDLVDQLIQTKYQATVNATRISAANADPTGKLANQINISDPSGNKMIPLGQVQQQQKPAFQWIH